VPVPRSSLSFLMLLRNWWPVLVWLGVLRLESTDIASSSNTSILLYQASLLVFGRVNFAVISVVNEVMRKTGHFAGYGILGALVFVALRNTHRDRRLDRGLAINEASGSSALGSEAGDRNWGSSFVDLWQSRWAVAGILFTALVAAADEIHQTFLPSRTGRWQDVVLDTCGAIVAQILLYIWTKRSFGLHGSAHRIYGAK
jgi:VanZ family protein